MWLLVLFLVGCPADKTNLGQPGELCFPNGSCMPGFVCAENVCSTMPDAGDTDLSSSDIKQDIAEDKTGTADDGTIDPACEPGSGCLGEPCTDNGDCDSGVCTTHMGDRACSKLCVDECPAGWSCVPVDTGSGDALFACVSNFSHLCLPCTNNGDCSTDQTPTICINYGSEGAFCGASCTDTSDCPDDFVCEEITSIAGGLSKQCIQTAGVCECSQFAVTQGLVTDCEQTNVLGSCHGVRLCTEDGLSECDAPIPSAETCDGTDEDCDGEVDEDSCDDNNPCTIDICGGPDGCSHEPQSETQCDDGNACTYSDHCSSGVCVGTTVECIDGNGCTDDICDDTFGCVFENTSTPCDDGNSCSFGDACTDGSCVAGVVLECDDDNQCTDDICDPNGGCIFSGNNLPCDDGNPCTLGDSCSAGSCAGTEPKFCDDGNVCTTDYCDPVDGCMHINNSNPCNDNDTCTLNDICVDGACESGTPLSCDDGNSCTSDVCNPLIGCTHANHAEPCDDGDPCTLNDFCAAGSCISMEMQDCTDANPCTVEMCLPMVGCTYEANTGPCNDNDLCTVGDTCGGTLCAPGTDVLVCDDGNPCTDDYCDPELGCMRTLNDLACDDHNTCTTNDVCVDGFCIGTGSLNCDDGNSCTLDICAGADGCLYEDLEVACTDGDVCTMFDACSEGSCLSGSIMGCDDGNPCTDDSCDPNTGCIHSPNTVSCDDGNSCTTTDTCSAGACLGNVPVDCDDDNVCTTDGCIPATGCTHTNNTAPCEDSDACTVFDACLDGSCSGGTAIVCFDGNDCTDDDCDPATGCVNPPSSGGCDDDNACTTGETCSDGLCQGGSAVGCDDGNSCTTNSCDPDAGCIDTPATGPSCSDGDLCTLDDTCQDGVCTGGPTDSCDDGNVCTDNNCNPASGCEWPNNTAACDDGVNCTSGDVCSGGTCSGTGTGTIQVYDHMVGVNTMLSCGGGHDGFNFLCNHMGYGAFTGNAPTGDFEGGDPCWAVGEADGRINEMYNGCGGGCTHYLYVECEGCP